MSLPCSGQVSYGRAYGRAARSCAPHAGVGAPGGQGPLGCAKWKYSGSPTWWTFDAGPNGCAEIFKTQVCASDQNGLHD